MKVLEALFAPGSWELWDFCLGLTGGVFATWFCSGIFYRWRQNQLEKTAVAHALDRSRAILKGQAAEQLAPLSDDFGYLPNEARFLGSPIDYLIFDGISDQDEELEIVFLEVKSGKAQLTARERKVRDAVEEGRVRWEELRL